MGRQLTPAEQAAIDSKVAATSAMLDAEKAARDAAVQPAQQTTASGDSYGVVGGIVHGGVHYA